MSAVDFGQGIKFLLFSRVQPLNLCEEKRQEKQLKLITHIVQVGVQKSSSPSCLSHESSFSSDERQLYVLL